jgi:hypothetical protein
MRQNGLICAQHGAHARRRQPTNNRRSVCPNNEMTRSSRRSSRPLSFDRICHTTHEYALEQRPLFGYDRASAATPSHRDVRAARLLPSRSGRRGRAAMAPAAGRSRQPRSGRHSAGRTDRSARRLVNGDAGVVFPRFRVRHCWTARRLERRARTADCALAGRGVAV